MLNNILGSQKIVRSEIIDIVYIVDSVNSVDTIDIDQCPDYLFTLLRQPKRIILVDSVVIPQYQFGNTLSNMDLRDASASKKRFFLRKRVKE